MTDHQVVSRADWRAVVVGPVVHELVDDELSLSGEQVEQRFRAG